VKLGIVSDEIARDFASAVRVGVPLGLRRYEIRNLAAGRAPGDPSSYQKLAEHRAAQPHPVAGPRTVRRYAAGCGAQARGVGPSNPEDKVVVVPTAPQRPEVCRHMLAVAVGLKDVGLLGVKEAEAQGLARRDEGRVVGVGDVGPPAVEILHLHRDFLGRDFPHIAFEKPTNHLGVRMVRNRDAVIRKKGDAKGAAFEGNAVDVKTAVVVNGRR